MGGTAPSAPAQVANSTNSPKADPLRVGDKVRVELGGLPTTSQTPLPLDQEIKEDGTINMPHIGTVQAAGKTPSEVEQDIFKKYVPSYYQSVTVTVSPSDRFYYVGGQVNRPGEQHYNGAITVSKAIQAGGDFTDFANRRKILLIRMHGKIENVNYYKIIEHPELDPQVYPGDKIEVKRRIF